MTDFINESWIFFVRKIAQNFWLAYAYEKTDTSGAHALERFIPAKRSRESSETSNKYKRYESGRTRPSKATIREVEEEAFGAASILEHRVWRLLACENFEEQDHMAALRSHAISEETRLFVDRKLPILIKAENICFFDRLEIILHVAALAALRGDIFLFKQAKKQSANLLQHLLSYATPALEPGLQALVCRWIGAKYGKLKKKQIALMSSKTDYKLLPLALLILFLPVFQKHAGMQTLSVAMGLFLLAASFEPKLRYWWVGYHRNTPH